MSRPVTVVVAVVLTAVVTSAVMYIALFTDQSTRAYLSSPLQAAQSWTASQLGYAGQDEVARTTYRCRRMGAWGDVCVYENLCWDGNAFLVVNETSEAVPGFGASTDDMLEGVIWPSKRPFDPRTSAVPFNSGAMRVGLVPPAYLSKNKVTWVNNTMWRLPFRYPLENIWYTASRVLPIYRARKMNESGWFSPPLPPLGADDFMFTDVPAEPFQTDWTRNVVGLSSGNKSRVEYGDGGWNKQWTVDNLVCFKKAVASGSFAAGVPDLETAFQFRRDMYEFVGISVPSQPAKKVLFWFRNPPLGRAVLNTDALLRVADYYNVTYTVITEVPTSFSEQMRLFTSHGVMVAPHGAGLMNAMFLLPFSSVIEIFPYHMDHNIYSTVALTSGLGYYPVHTYNGSDMWSRDTLNFEKNCEELTVLEANWVDGDCRDPLIHYQIEVNVRDFEAALVNALEHSGFRTRFRGIAPTRDPSTATGWKI